jgi:hypothetical protein
MSETLRHIANELAAEAADAQMPKAGSEECQVTPKQVRRVICARRKRVQFFGDDLFGEPAWDILLDLFATHLTGGRVSTSSLCIAADVPSTTALRWIGVLCERDLLLRPGSKLELSDEVSPVSSNSTAASAAATSGSATGLVRSPGPPPIDFSPAGMNSSPAPCKASSIVSTEPSGTTPPASKRSIVSRFDLAAWASWYLSQLRSARAARHNSGVNSIATCASIARCSG